MKQKTQPKLRFYYFRSQNSKTKVQNPESRPLKPKRMTHSQSFSQDYDTRTLAFVTWFFKKAYAFFA